MRFGQLLLLVALILAALAPHLGAIDNEFVFDDNGVIVENEAVTGLDLKRIWTSPYWPALPNANLYRPLASTTYALNWAAGDGQAATFVVVNLILHVAATLVALWLLRRILPNAHGVAWAAAFLFAVHPIHVEAVVGIVGRAETLAAVLTLGSYLLWLRSERSENGGFQLLAVLLWILALLSKESAIALPGLLLLHRLRIVAPPSRARRFRLSDLAWPAGLIAVFALRLNALGRLTSPGAGHIDNPLASLDPIMRALGAGGVLARQFGQILTGRGFSPDYSFAEVVPGTTLYATGAIMLFVLAFGLFAALRWGRTGPEGWGLAFFFFFWLVTSNLLVPIGTVQADRLFYLPLLGLLVVAASSLSRIPLGSARRYFCVIVLILFTFHFGIASAMQTKEWRTNRTLFSAAVRESPSSVKARSNLAAVMLKDHSKGTAREVLEMINPVLHHGRRYGPLMQREAKARMFIGERERARELFRRSLHHGADSAEVLVELGNLAIMAGEGDTALACFDLVMRTGKRSDHAAIGRASALSTMGRYDEAANSWLPVLAALPDSVPVRVACAWNLREAGRLEEASLVVSEGLSDRSDPRLWNAYARILLASGMNEDAHSAALQATSTGPTEEHLTTLALTQIATGRDEEAISTRSLIADPDYAEEVDEALRTSQME